MIACVALPLGAATGQIVANTVPPYVSTAKNLGPADASTTIDVSLWLNVRNRSTLDSMAAQLYDRSSPNYRHWLKPADLIADFAPSAQDLAAAKQFFLSHNLSIVTVGPANLFVRARGTVGDMQKAFQVQLNNYSINGKTYRAPASDPYVDGPAAGLVRLVSGLDSGGFSHPLAKRPSMASGSEPSLAAQPSSADAFSSVCFTGVTSQSYTTGGTFPTGTFAGNGYTAGPGGSNPGCGYTPAELYTAYNLTGLYNEGYDGAGQTIAIIDWCGSPTITQDANAFSKEFNLPMLTSANFGIIQVPTPSQCESPDIEINLDVEWSHAVAPGANINLIVPATSSFQDVDEAESYIIIYGYGNVISGSYASLESFDATTEVDNENLINEMAAVSGISANFSSGDDGDYTVYGIPPTVSAPADGTYATAIGGVTVALNANNTIAWQAGWGNDETGLAFEGSIDNPPLAFGFVYGSGGGPSAVFAKPSYQVGAGVPGSMRQLPDISWVGDPFTGVLVLISNPFQSPAQVLEAIGGTSVACPMFSALWAIANEEAGFALGQAAPYVYTLPAGAVTDVVPVSSANNVTASIHLSSTMADNYGANAVMGGATNGLFYSAIWDYPLYQDVAYAISFGTDCNTVTESGGPTPCNDASSLRTRPGWDNVTGVGTPNAQAFADSFKP
jgi:subtilase family serine protease